MAKEEGAAAPTVEEATAAELARLNGGGLPIAGPADVTAAQLEHTRLTHADEDVPDDVAAAAGQPLVGLGPIGGDTPSVPTAQNPSPGVAVGGIPSPTPPYVNTDLPAAEGAQGEAAANAAEGLAAAEAAHTAAGLGSVADAGASEEAAQATANDDGEPEGNE